MGFMTTKLNSLTKFILLGYELYQQQQIIKGKPSFHHHHLLIQELVFKHKMS